MSSPYTKYVNEENNNRDVEDYINSVKNNSGNFMRADHLRFNKLYTDKFLFISLFFKFLFSILKGGFFKKDIYGYKNNKKHIIKKNRPSITSNLFYKFLVSIKTMYSRFIFEKIRQNKFKKLFNFLCTISTRSTDSAIK